MTNPDTRQHSPAATHSPMAEATHTVSVGEVTRALPVREVKEGLSVALFNPLGDWELNEALGTELTPLIPAGTVRPPRPRPLNPSSAPAPPD